MAICSIAFAFGRNAYHDYAVPTIKIPTYTTLTYLQRQGRAKGTTGGHDPRVRPASAQNPQ
jgi:hypothetical protein